jgi:hypothetical protein
MQPYRLFRWLSFALLLLSIALLTPASARPQAGDDILPTTGMTALENEGREKSNREASKVLKGDIAFDPKKEEQRKGLDYQARWATYRFTWPEYQTGSPDPQKNLDNLHRSFDGDLNQLSRNPKAREVAPFYCKQVILHALEVVKETRKPIAQINGARVLARLPAQEKGDSLETVVARLIPPESGQPPVGDNLADALIEAAGHRNDGVKYYAFKGISDLLHVAAQSKDPVLGKDKLAALVEALTRFISRKVEFPSTASVEEREGYRVVRREAIRALAQVRQPALSAALKPAWTLLQVVANQGLTPEARSDERIEAAIGLGRMKPDADKDFQADYAMYHIALLWEEVARGIVNGKEHLRAWKPIAAQTTDALAELKASSGDKYVADVFEALYKIILQRLEDKGADAKISDADFRALRDKLVPPPSKSLFKRDDKATLKTGK